MSISPHRISHDLYKGPKLLADPGDGKVITPSADLQVCELTTGASNETRVLANPTKPGIRFVLRMKTDGGGDAVVTAENGLNSVPEVSATFADAGDMLSMISVSLTATTFRWEVLERTGVAIASSTGTATSSSSATATASSTATSTATATATSSSTSTSSASTSGATTSATFSATATSTSSSTKTGTPTSTTSSTGTATSSRTATATATGTQ